MRSQEETVTLQIECTGRSFSFTKVGSSEATSVFIPFQSVIIASRAF